MKERKALLRQKEQEIHVQEQGRLTLEESISCTLTEFPTEEEQEEEDAASTLAWLSRIRPI